jgi:hypothetical protein
MQERGWIEPIVERVVGEVLDSHAAQLRTEIVRRVMEEIAAAPASDETIAHATESSSASSDAASASGPADLARAVAEIQLGASQREILRALLDTSARYAARVALFVVKGSHATGWQGRGFANSDGLKDFALDESAPAVVRAISDRVVARAPSADMGARFMNDFGTPASGEGRILPLILKDKVAALVYADSGTGPGGLLEAGSLDLLVLSTGAWLEVNSLRKQAQTQWDSRSVPAAEPSPYQTPTQPAPAQPVPAFNDPFASHVPGYASGQAMAASASAGEVSAPVASAPVEAPVPVPVPIPMQATGSEGVTAEADAAIPEVESAIVELDPAQAEPLPTGPAETERASEMPPVAAISPEDQDIQRKAQRFARLLVDEIKLYNQAKVAEGRKNKDLYDRLKEAIEKSRGTYQKRYGNTVAASGNYFQNEIIRSLAEEDLSVMGANFRQ